MNRIIDHYIYRPYITVKGKRRYPKNGRCFKIPVYKDDLVVAKSSNVS